MVQSLNFSERSSSPELMDTEPVGFDEFNACLVDLARVNRLTLAYRPTLAFFDRIAAAARALKRPLEVIDVGSGYGDMLRAIDAWSMRRGVSVSLTGVDLNPWSRQAALGATRASRNIQWVTADAFEYEPKAGIDVVISSLFTHHLPNPLVVKFLRWMDDKARIGYFINDLHRHPLPYYFFRSFAKMARFHRFVQHDGPVSIARAFERKDWIRLLREAQIDEHSVEIEWKVPFRLTVGKIKRG